MKVPMRLRSPFYPAYYELSQMIGARRFTNAWSHAVRGRMCHSTSEAAQETRLQRLDGAFSVSCLVGILY
jgi:hypothetical protein